MTGFIEKIKKTTPRGKFQFPHLIRPDTRFDGNDYKVTVRFDPDADGVQDFLDVVRKFDDDGYEAALKEVGKKRLPRRKCISDSLDKDEEPTGEVEIRCKTKAEGKNRKTGETFKRTLKLFNAKGADVTGKIESIWSGTVGKVSVTLVYNKAPNGYGVTMYIDAVQIIDLKKGGGGSSADDFGFDSDEEGSFNEEPEFSDESSEEDSDDIPF
jgi:hypothetical protein